MLEITLLGSLGLSFGLLGTLLWLVRRAFSDSDRAAVETKRADDADRQLDARGRAVDDRDRVIAALQEENGRLRLASEQAAKMAEDALLHSFQIGGKDAAASATLRSSIDSLRALSQPGIPWDAVSVGTTTARAPSGDGAPAVHGADPSVGSAGVVGNPR